MVLLELKRCHLCILWIVVPCVHVIFWGVCCLQCDMTWYLSCSSLETSCRHCAIIARFLTMSITCTPLTMDLNMFALSIAYITFLHLYDIGIAIMKKCSCLLLPTEISCLHPTLKSKPIFGMVLIVSFPMNKFKHSLPTSFPLTYTCLQPSMILLLLGNNPLLQPRFLGQLYISSHRMQHHIQYQGVVVKGSFIK